MGLRFRFRLLGYDKKGNLRVRVRLGEELRLRLGFRLGLILGLGLGFLPAHSQS
jgi:hypothetical protein